VRLDAGSRIVRLVVEGYNLAGDHRLRVTFPLPATSDRTVADMQFGPVTRDVGRDDGQRYAMEWPVTTAPMHRYVSVAGGGGTGVTVFSRGLFEYEPTDDGRLAVTIHRSVGQLSRDGLPARPGHAGWPVATPDAQELGPFRVELGVAFTAAADPGSPSTWHRLERLAEEFHASLAGMMLRHAIDPPETVPGPALLGEGLVFKVLKTAERGDAMVLRCVNVTSQPVRGVCRWPAAMSKAAKARLDETPIQWLDVAASPREVVFEAAPREVVTLLVWP
jgi:mannosylglycerate hydrolase